MEGQISIKANLDISLHKSNYFIWKNKYLIIKSLLIPVDITL